MDSVNEGIAAARQKLKGADATVDEEMAAARQKLKDKCGDSTRLGGKGTARRKKRAPHKSAGGDDKKLQTVLKRLGLSNIPGIEEVAMFRDDQTVMHFTQPKVQASPASNTYVVTGHVEEKSIEQVFPPGIDTSKLSPELFKRLQAEFAASAALSGMNKGGKAMPKVPEETGEDEDVPDLVDNFDDVANVD